MNVCSKTIGMLGKLSASPLLSCPYASHCFSTPDIATSIPNNVLLNVNFSNGLTPNIFKGVSSSRIYRKKLSVYSATQIDNIILSDEDRMKWESCRQALSTFNFSVEEEDKILGKAFGHIHSPYWSEDRKREVPEFESINEILDYLRNLDLSDDEIHKLLKNSLKFLDAILKKS